MLSSTTMDAPRPPATHVGRLVAESTGIAAAATICTTLTRMYPRLVRRAPREYRVICSSRRCHEGDEAGASAAALLPGLEEVSGGAMGVVVALIAGPPSSCARPFHVAPRRADRCPKVRLTTDFVSARTILSRFGAPKRDRTFNPPATALARRR